VLLLLGCESANYGLQHLLLRMKFTLTYWVSIIYILGQYVLNINLFFLVRIFCCHVVSLFLSLCRGVFNYEICPLIQQNVNYVFTCINKLAHNASKL
jgi:hypothetical protein